MRRPGARMYAGTCRTSGSFAVIQVVATSITADVAVRLCRGCRESVPTAASMPRTVLAAGPHATGDDMERAHGRPGLSAPPFSPQSRNHARFGCTFRHVDFERVPDGSDVVVFLASERASYLSGIVVTVDGGQAARGGSF